MITKRKEKKMKGQHNLKRYEFTCTFLVSNKNTTKKLSFIVKMKQ